MRNAASLDAPVQSGHTNANRRSRLACAGILMILGLFLALPGQAQSEGQEDDADEEILVRTVVPRDYHQPGKWIDGLPKILENSLQKTLTVEQGQSLSGILHKEYRVSPSWTPDVYAAFERHVKLVNKVDDPVKDLKAGQLILLPDMPQAAQSLKILGAKKMVGSKTTFGVVGAKGVLQSGIDDLNAVSELATRVTQIRAIGRREYEKLNINPQATRQELEDAGLPVPLRGSMVAKLAVGSSTGGALDDEQKKLLSDFLKRPAKSRPFVVILDDSWPSQDDFRDSANFVIEASRKIRAAYSLNDASAGDSADVKALIAEMGKGTSFCDADCEYPKMKWHAAMIRKSIEEMRSLDTGKRVEVIYLPLNRSQTFAKNVLGEMIRVTQLADSVQSQLVLQTDVGAVPTDTLPGIPDHAGVEQIVKKLLAPPRLGAIPSAYVPGAQLQVSTDKAVVDAVINFMVLYSAASRRPHFISFSWTTPKNSLAAIFRQEAYGLWIAAAGNDAGVNVHAQSAQFAARSATPGDFLAVQNLSEAGCETSKLSDNPALHVYGLAYQGRFDASHCGTSFSTPRVAWLLAAREAIKVAPIMPAMTEEWTQWQKLRMESLLKLTRPQMQGEDRYRVTLRQLLDE